jgi:hypothetical protein
VQRDDYRATLIVMFGLAAANLTGFLRQAAIAHQLGAGRAADIYLVAFAVPEFIFVALPIVLSPAFIPLFADCRLQAGEASAWRFGFARWYAETDGCPGGVFAASFKEKADFGQVIGSIVGYGTDFSLLPDEEQWEYLVRYLRENRCLLIWDNFERVAGYPADRDPLATAEEQVISE